MARRGSARFYLEFLEDVSDVLLHGARTEAENDRYFAVTFSFTNPLHHFAFTRGEPERGKMREINRDAEGRCGWHSTVRSVRPGGGVHRRGC